LGRANAERCPLDHDHLCTRSLSKRDWVGEEPLMIEAAEGTELIDSDGRRYLDGASSLWCNVHGHRHPAIDQAVASSSIESRTPPCSPLPSRAAELAARLVEIAPAGLSRVLLLGLRIDRRRGRF